MSEPKNQPVAESRDGEALAAFRSLALADTALHPRWGAMESLEDYIAEAMKLATSHGIGLSAETIRAAIRPDPIAISRFQPNPTTLDRWPGRGWLPARSVETGGEPAFDWLWFGDAPLDAPFFDDMVRRVASRPFNLMFRIRTSSASLLDGIDAADGPAPSGFVHHMSRCGSTLVARVLASDPAHLVLSEAEPLDAVLRWAMATSAPLAERMAALRAIVAALGRHRTGGTRRVFFKLNSWHVLALPLFRAAFPDTPWVYLYRNPVEVLVSQRRSRGLHTVAGTLPSGLIDIAGAEGMDDDHYAAWVLRRMGEAVLRHWSVGGGLSVDYGEMPAAIGERIAPHFGFVPDVRQCLAMIDAIRRDAKEPKKEFVSDSEEKRQAASSNIEMLSRDLVDPIYRKLKLLEE